MSSSTRLPPPLVDLVSALARMVTPGRLTIKDYLLSLPIDNEGNNNNNRHHHHDGGEGATGAGDVPTKANSSRAVLVRQMKELVQALTEVLTEVEASSPFSVAGAAGSSSSSSLERNKAKVADEVSPSILRAVLESSHSLSSSPAPECGQREEVEKTTITLSSPLATSACTSGRQLLEDGKAGPTSPTTASEMVLANGSLLSEIFTFLLSGAEHQEPRQAKAQLCCLGVVSKTWWEASSTDRYWRPIALALFPVLTMQPPPPSYRDYVHGYGRALIQRAVQDGDTWQHDLLLSFEIYDEVDGTRFFSSLGPVELILSAESGLTAIRLTGTKRNEMSRPFSATSRDPGHLRFSSMRDYFTHNCPSLPFSVEGPLPVSSISIRVVAIEASTGKKALLYKSSKKTQRSAKLSTLQYWQQWLAPGSVFVWESWSRWSVGSGHTHVAAEVSTSFYASPLPGQGDVPEIRKQYIITGGDTDAYRDHNSFVALQFRTLDAGLPGRFFSSALSSSAGYS